MLSAFNEAVSRFHLGVIRGLKKSNLIGVGRAKAWEREVRATAEGASLFMDESAFNDGVSATPHSKLRIFKVAQALHAKAKRADDYRPVDPHASIEVEKPWTAPPSQREAHLTAMRDDEDAGSRDTTPESRRPRSVPVLLRRSINRGGGKADILLDRGEEQTATPRRRLSGAFGVELE